MSGLVLPAPGFLSRGIASTTSACVVLLLAMSLGAPPRGLTAQDELQTCEGPVGTLAVIEPQEELLERLYDYGLESPTGVIRRMVQESNCFIVVERGLALERMAQERELARGGDLVSGSNVGAGQMQAADFYLTPDILFSDDDAGGIGGALGGLVGGGLGAVAAGLKFKEAQTSILVTATRSGVQIAAAEGQARETDFALGGLAFLGGAAGGLGGYSSTDEGKVIMASFLDNWNNIVESVRDDPNLTPLTPEQVRARITGEAEAGGGFNPGDVVLPKIDNTQIVSAPDPGASAVTSANRSDALVFLGTEENGYLQVQSSDGAGWVLKVLVDKQ